MIGRALKGKYCKNKILTVRKASKTFKEHFLNETFVDFLSKQDLIFMNTIQAFFYLQYNVTVGPSLVEVVVAIV